MTFHARMRIGDDATITIRLDGELDSGSAPVLNKLIAEAAQQEVVRKLVLLMGQLTYLSSAGLRCIVFAHQKFGSAVEIVLVGARPDVVETIRMTGIDRSVTLQDPVDV